MSWRLVMDPKPPLSSLPGILRIYLAGNALNYVAPGSVAGEPVRANMLRDRMDTSGAIASVTIFKHAHLLSQTFFVASGMAVAVVYFDLPTGVRWAALGSLIVLCGLLVLMTWGLQKGSFEPILAALSRFRPLAARLSRHRETARRLDEEIRRFYVHRRPHFFASAAWCLLGWCGGLLETYIVLRLLAPGRGWETACAVESLAMVLNNMFLFVPGRAGTAESVRAGVFVLLGLPASTGVAYGLVRRAREILWVLPGLAFLAHRPTGRRGGRPGRVRIGARLSGAARAMTAPPPARAARAALRLRRHTRRPGRAVEGALLPDRARGGARPAPGGVRPGLLRRDGCARGDDPAGSGAPRDRRTGGGRALRRGSAAIRRCSGASAPASTTTRSRQLAESAALLAGLRGRYRIGVVSNFYGNLQAVLDETGLASAIEVAVDSTRVGCKKPDPRIFRAALDALDAAPGRRSSWATRRLGTWQGARAIGMRHVWLRPPDAPGRRPLLPGRHDHPEARRSSGARAVRRGAEAPVCWGVYREREHSPGREADDAGVLEATGRLLERSGATRRVSPAAGASRAAEPHLPVLAFAMCEGAAALERLDAWERRGVCTVNRASAVVNAQRERAIPLFEARRIPMPESRLLDGDRPLPGRGEMERLFSACWIKPAIGHKTRADDVVFASGTAAVRDALDRLRSRGTRRAVVQRHAEGDLVKFYGVAARGRSGIAAPAAWFRWFHPKEHPVAGHAVDAEALTRIALRAARALGLEVWGGDAVVTPSGEILVIDVNAWPSFALFRDEAAGHIAAHLSAHLRRIASVAV